MQESIVFYKSFYEAIRELEPELQVEIYNALFDYGFEGIENNLSPIAKAVFTLIKPQIDANARKKEQGKINGQKGAEFGKLGAEFGKLGGRPRKARIDAEEEEINGENNPPNNPPKTPQEDEKTPSNVNVNDNVNDNVNKKEKKKREKKSQEPKELKDSYGELGNVKLTKAEYERLVKDYGEDATKKAIEYLDGYIVDKRYKSDDNNRALRRWVFDAVKEQEQKRARIKSYDDKPGAGKPKNKFNQFPQNSYNFDELEAVLIDN